MKKAENKNYIAYANEVFDYFKLIGSKAGVCGPYFKWLQDRKTVEELEHARFLKHTAKNLIQTGYLEFKMPFMVVLTEMGYEYTQGGTLLCNSIDLTQFVDSQQDANKQFNQLWDIIGVKETALFYVDGPNFYRLASALLEGLPSNYLEFMSSLDISKQSRRYWYRDLYLSLSDDLRTRLLQLLSECINNIYDAYYPKEQNEQEKMMELATSPTKVTSENYSDIMTEERKIKIFISHSSKDEKIVKAFVDLLIDLSVKDPSQLFCSCYPPFDVKVNDDIYETLKKQYNDYQLFMIYMLSDNYYDSPVSLNEMGAGWVLQYDYQCVLLPGFSAGKIKGCVSGSRKALRLDSDNLKTELNNFKESVVKMMGLPSINVNLWERKRDEFINKITASSADAI